mmetsp:Transcript_88256/g.227585  ORF Transcript_88256/g.227585 Transcript_88256/m.227585 type:complete len:231 (+) Transcript_88256:201-893(+)
MQSAASPPASQPDIQLANRRAKAAASSGQPTRQRTDLPSTCSVTLPHLALILFLVLVLVRVGHGTYRRDRLCCLLLVGLDELLRKLPLLLSLALDHVAVALELHTLSVEDVNGMNRQHASHVQCQHQCTLLRGVDLEHLCILCGAPSCSRAGSVDTAEAVHRQDQEHSPHDLQDSTQRRVHKQLRDLPHSRLRTPARVHGRSKLHAEQWQPQQQGPVGEAHHRHHLDHQL